MLRSLSCVLCCAVLQLHDELGNARGINDLTADETTKVLLENSRLQQVRVTTQTWGAGAKGLGFRVSQPQAGKGTETVPALVCGLRSTCRGGRGGGKSSISVGVMLPPTWDPLQLVQAVP